MESNWGLAQWLTRRGYWSRCNLYWSWSSGNEGVLGKSWGSAPCDRAESLKRAQERLLVKVQTSYRTDYRLLEMSVIMEQPSKSTTVKRSWAETMKHAMWKDRNGATHVLWTQKIISPTCPTLGFTAGLWFCFDLNITMPWFFPFEIRKHLACFYILHEQLSNHYFKLRTFKVI